jgi:hypothetical protein
VNQPLEGGRPKKNNRKRFQKTVVGVDVVLKPVKNPEAYMIVDAEDEDNEESSESSGSSESEERPGDEMDVDGPSERTGL